MIQRRTTKQIGDFGEKAAVHYLRMHGYTVKERNYRAGKYEIDVILIGAQGFAWSGNAKYMFTFSENFGK